MFEFDAEKSRTNKVKHGIDFFEAQNIWESTYIIIPTKNVLGENRSAIIGTLGHTFYVAIFTIRSEKIRIISCHKADKRWVKIYEKYIDQENE